jgi:hypothetical protein
MANLLKPAWLRGPRKPTAKAVDKRVRPTQAGVGKPTLPSLSPAPFAAMTQCLRSLGLRLCMLDAGRCGASAAKNPAAVQIPGLLARSLLPELSHGLPTHPCSPVVLGGWHYGAIYVRQKEI